MRDVDLTFCPVMGMRPLAYGSAQAIDVLVVEDPETERETWFHLESGEYTVD